VKTLKILTALMLVASLAAPTTAQGRAHKRSARDQTQQAIEGREVAAPPWSAACMTDHGPSECGEPMWIYGSSGGRVTYRNAF
jgi:hypothetical protein